MSAEEPSPRWLRVKKSCGSEMRVDILNGALIAHDLMIELADMVFEAGNPVNLLCKVVASFLLALADELCKVLDKVVHLSHAKSGDRGVDHADDGGGEGPQVVVTGGQSVQQQLLGGRCGFGRPGLVCRGVDDFFGRRVEFRVL